MSVSVYGGMLLATGEASLSLEGNAWLADRESGIGGVVIGLIWRRLTGSLEPGASKTAARWKLCWLFDAFFGLLSAEAWVEQGCRSGNRHHRSFLTVKPRYSEGFVYRLKTAVFFAQLWLVPASASTCWSL